jgi:hypothetical protein
METKLNILYQGKKYKLSFDTLERALVSQSVELNENRSRKPKLHEILSDGGRKKTRSQTPDSSST